MNPLKKLKVKRFKITKTSLLKTESSSLPVSLNNIQHMKINILFKLLLFIFISHFATAQVEVSLYQYPTDGESFTAHIAPHDDGRILALYNRIQGDHHYTILNTDANGEEIARIERLQLNGVTVSSITYLLEQEEIGILGLASIYDERDGQGQFISFTIAPDLTITIIDTAYIEPKTKLIFRKIKKNPTLQLLEGIGHVYSENDQRIQPLQVLMQLDGTFERLNYNILQTPSRSITDFVYNPELEQYMLILFPVFTMFADKDLVFLDQIQNRFPQLYQDTTWHHSFVQSACTLTEEDVECIGLGYPTDHRMAIHNWTWTEDSAEITTAHPITPVGMERAVDGLGGRRDTDNNIYLYAREYSFFFNQTPEPNFVYAAKYNTNKELLWEVTFRDDVNEFVGRDLEVDHNRNFLIGGEMTTDRGITNFLLKIHAPDALTNNLEFPSNLDDKVRIFPNPTVHFLHVEIDENILPCQYNIYNTIGMPIQTGTFTASNSAIELSSLTAGIYQITMLKDNAFSTKRFIKH